MKLLIIGQSLEDHINYKGKTQVKPGGIFYTVYGLKNFISSVDEIALCTSVEKENLKLFSPAYDDLDKKYFQFVPSIPKVILNITDEKEREECYSQVNKNIDINIDDFSSFNGILINMITGFDITISQLEKIRKSYSGLIYFDVHTLARGLDEKGKREFRTIPAFEKWANNIDILQANETEFSFLYDINDSKEILNKLFASGIKILVLTKGEKGAKVYYKKDREIISTFTSSHKIETRNNVGCGDIFGAVFFYNYITDKNIEKALMLANLSAGCAASYDDLHDFEKLKKDVYERIS